MSVTNELNRIGIEGDAEQLMQLRCPTCSGSLSVAYTEGRKSAVGFFCEKCLYNLNIDGIFPRPPWVERLGTRARTHGQV